MTSLLAYRYHLKQFFYSISQAVSDDNGRPSYIAPGSEDPETKYYDLVTDNKVRYLLPEYPSSFLLARNLELQFSGMDDKAVWHAMSEYTRSTSGGGFAFFSMSKSKTKSNSDSNLRVERTASGMRVAIPGAQIIGYYTIKLPRFPPLHK